jgi:N-sulfoglucosamine sulfohydrolase
LKKNIIYIHTHDTGRYIQPYGHAIPTPHLMKLAEESTIFRQAFSAAPVCSASRSSLLTGMYPHNHGMVGLAHRGFEIKDYSKHLSRFLSGHGYLTALCGVQHEIEKKRSSELGYERMWEQKDDEANALLVADFIREQHDRPFFLSFGMTNTHKEYPQSHEGINAAYVIPPFPLYDNKLNREEMARYMASAKVVDECVGIVMDALKESGKEEETIVFFTTDHGVALPHMKCSLYDTGIGVSLMMKFAGNPTRGEAVDGMVSQIDLYPTLCDLIGVPHPDWLQGYSMLPLLEGKEAEIRKELYAEVSYHASYEPLRCIRTERYKYIRRFDDHDGIVPSNIDGGIGKDFLMENGLLDIRLDKEMLFDLYHDPTERNNLVAQPASQAVYKDLSGRLDAWMRETDDLLIHGKYPKPTGALINKLSCIDPSAKDYE